jgi:hypothetical protein
MKQSGPDLSPVRQVKRTDSVKTRMAPPAVVLTESVAPLPVQGK